MPDNLNKDEKEKVRKYDNKRKKRGNLYCYYYYYTNIFLQNEFVFI